MNDGLIPGVRRRPIRTTGNRGALRWYILINLAELTDVVVRNEPAGGGVTKDEWSDDEIAMLIYGPTTWGSLSPRAQEDNISALLDYLRHDDHNKLPFDLARTDTGFKSKATHPPLQDPVATVLYVPESVSRLKLLRKRREIGKFADRYREMVADRTYRMVYPDTDFHVALEGFRASSIKRVVEKNIQLEEQLAVLREGVERLEFLHQVVCAMLDFVASPSERKRLWNTTKPFVTSPFAYEKNFIKEPSPRLRSNAVSLRAGILPNLINEVTSALEWRMAGEAPPGHPGTADLEIAKTRNAEAMKLLEDVRTNEIIQLLLDEHENVVPTTRNLLEEVLAEAFAQITTAPPALRQLLDSEITTLARVAVTGSFDTDRCITRGQEDKKLLDEIRSFVPQNELIESANDFTARLARLRDTADIALEGTPLLYRLLTVGSPYLLPRLRKLGLNRAFAVHLFVNVFAEDPRNEVLTGLADMVAQHYLDFVLTKDPQQLNRFLDDFIRKTARIRVMSAAAWSGMKFLLAATSLGIAFAETSGSDTDAKRAAQSVAVATNALQTVQGAADFLGKSLEAAPFVQGRLRNAHSYYEKMTTVAAKTAGERLSFVDPVVGVLEFTSAAISYGDANRAYRQAKRKGRGSTNEEVDRDLARGKAVMAAVGVATSVATLALGASLPLAGAALLLAGLALDKDVWKALEGDLPGPGKLAQDTYLFLTSTPFQRALKYYPHKDRITEQLDLLKPFVDERTPREESAFWKISPGQQFKGISTSILQTQYGISEELADKLAEE